MATVASSSLASTATASTAKALTSSPTMGSLEAVPFWHYNVPLHERTAECPPFLVGLSEKDRGIIGSPDDAHPLLSWDRVCALVAANRLNLFHRLPSHLRRYKAFTHALALRHGSVADFILRERLRWAQPVVPSAAASTPFACSDDIAIIHNDWPYSLDRRIVHLVVWTKFPFAEDPSNADLTDAARADIEAFVTTTFRDRMDPDRVVWFRNWSALKSIHAVEHFHVMLFDPDADFVRDVTGGDVPLCDRPDPWAIASKTT